MAVLHATNLANLILKRLDTEKTWLGVEDILNPIFLDNGWKIHANHLNQGRRVIRRLFTNGQIKKGGKGNAWMLFIGEHTQNGRWDRSKPFGVEKPQDDSHVNPDDVIDTEDEIPPHNPALAGTPNPVNPIEAKEIIELRSRVKLLENKNQSILSDLTEKENRLDQIEKLAAAAAAVKTIRIEKWDGDKPIILKNVILPSYFDMMLDLAKMRRNILLVGPAGCGKTTAAGLLAKTMGMEKRFGKMGGCGGLTESHLLGRYNPLEKEGKKYVPSQFVIRFEQGGVMLIDELDGADQNVLLTLNPALDRSGELPLMNRPNKPIAYKHKDFICVCTANTFGTGSNRMYAGRNQLDASTLSRFQIGMIEVDYDKNIERSICQDEELLNRIWEVRRKMQESCLRRVIDTRFIEDAWIMKAGREWNNDKILGQMLQGWSRDEQSKVGMAA